MRFVLSTIWIATFTAATVFAETNSDKTDVTNQVMCVLSADGSGFTTFETGLVHLCPKAFPDRTCKCQPGDRVLLRLYHARSTHGNLQTYTELVDILGPAPWPPLEDVSAVQVVRGQANGKLVRIRGVVLQASRDDLDTFWNWIILRTDSGDVCLATTENQYALKKLQSLVDAEVEVKGRCAAFEGWRQRLGFHIGLFGRDGIRLIRPARPDAFSRPYATEHDNGTHRVTTTGTVVTRTCDRVFLRTTDSRLFIVYPTTATALPDIGTHVDVAGFTGSDPFNNVLIEAVFRSSGQTNALDRTDGISSVEIGHLFADDKGRQRVDTSHNGRLVRVRGVVNRTLVNREKRTLQFASGNHEICVDVSGLGADAQLPETDSVLQVTGLCLAEFDAGLSNATFPRFRTFTIIPRRSEDLKVLANPPWWTPVRLKLAVLGLLLALGGGLIWIRSLRILSERRGRDLARSNMARVRAESKTEERTRLAVELHDALSQSLTGVSLQVDAAISACQQTPTKTAFFLQSAKALLTSSRKELQGCIWDLRNRTFEEKDLTEAILKVLAPYAQDAKISVRFNVFRELLSETATHALLSIVRELTANALRHGHASHIRIAGECEDGKVRFSVSDDGRGFDPENAPGPSQGHFGLQGIRERISGFDGELTISSRRNEGTRIVVTIRDFKP